MLEAPNRHRANDIIEQTRHAVSQWREFASAAGVRDINAAEVEPALNFRQTGTSLSKLGDATNGLASKKWTLI
jgi:hypothetical protein